jgi:DNA-binding LacI/PurR family transcriptional regulator
MGVEAAVGETDDEGVAGRRLAGYRSAFADRGIELSPDRIIRPPATIEGGEAAFLRVWSRGDRPTAVLCMSDATATGVLAAARRLGVRVPEELSIVGFDDLPLTRFTDPPLTTVHQPVRRKGEVAASMLLEALRRPSADGQGQVLVLETRLVVRRSTAAPSGDRSQEVVVAR